MFPGMLLRYWLSDFEMVPVAPLITGIIFYFTSHMRWISISRFLYFKIFSASFLITFLSPEIATSIDIHVYCLLSRIMMSGLLLGIVLSVRTYWFHNMVTLPLWLVPTNFGTFIIFFIIAVVVVVIFTCHKQDCKDYSAHLTQTFSRKIMNGILS